MKIDKVIMSCDDNETYLNLWPYVSKVCKLTLGITPVLFHITDEYSDFIPDKYGIVKKIKKHPELPTAFQSQIYRMYGTKFFYNENCLISDIDMLTFNKEYFVKQVEGYSDDCLITYLYDAYDLSRPDCQQIWGLYRIPMCYNLAKGKTFFNLLDLNCDFNEFAERIYNFDFGYVVPEFHRDEVFLGRTIHRNHHDIEIVKLKRDIQNVNDIPKRVEKKHFYEMNSDLIYTKELVDCHVASDWQSNMDIFKTKINDILVYS
jgi:hypothetical protein